MGLVVDAVNFYPISTETIPHFCIYWELNKKSVLHPTSIHNRNGLTRALIIYTIYLNIFVYTHRRQT